MSFNRELKAGGGAGAGGACRQRPSHPLAPLPSQLLASSSACTCPVLYTMSRHRNIQRTKDIFLLYFLSGVRRRSQECSLLPHTPPEVPFHFTGQNQFTGPSLSQSPARGAASLALPVAPSLTPDMASASPEAQDCGRDCRFLSEPRFRWEGAGKQQTTSTVSFTFSSVVLKSCLSLLGLL